MATPSPRTGQEMSDREARDFLASKDHGVLSLGFENRGYGFPISFTYDEEGDRIVLGFVNRPDSRKRQFASEATEATFTVYSYEDVDAWESVLVSGPIRKLPEDGSYRVPDVFFRRESDEGEGKMVDLDEFERTWYGLQVEAVSGRRSGG